ncbi:MAG: hypothetical protein R3Y63_08865 [Eubacteriales bacterium]
MKNRDCLSVESIKSLIYCLEDCNDFEKEKYATAEVVAWLEQETTELEGVEPVDDPGCYWMCGNCEFGGIDETDNFCTQCGTKIKWREEL